MRSNRSLAARLAARFDIWLIINNFGRNDAIARHMRRWLFPGIVDWVLVDRLSHWHLSWILLLRNRVTPRRIFPLD